MRTWEARGASREVDAELAEWRRGGRILPSQGSQFGIRSLNVSGCTQVSLEMLRALTVLSPGLEQLSATSFRTFHPTVLAELGVTATVRVGKSTSG